MMRNSRFQKKFFQQLHKYVAVAGQRLAVAAKAFAHQFRECRDQVRAAADMDFVHLDDSLSGTVSTDLKASARQ